MGYMDITNDARVARLLTSIAVCGMFLVTWNVVRSLEPSAIPSEMRPGVVRSSDLQAVAQMPGTRPDRVGAPSRRSRR
jgi:hypothetical protein